MELEGFDASAMAYMPPAMQPPNTTDDDGFTRPNLMGMDFHDMYSNFDMSTFAGSEDFTFQGMQTAISPGMHGIKGAQSQFEDQFSDVVSAWDTQTNHEANEPEASIDRDHKLLSFSTPSLDHVLLDYDFRAASLSLSAQLHGMFFLAESPCPTTADALPPPSELTCYRRNLFQITGHITLAKGLRYLMTEAGEQLDIIGQELTVSAVESTEGNPVKIISVPWKTPNPQQASADDKVEREPPAVPIDMNNAQDVDSEYAQFPFQWKRLQFRIATANNGRRKELQQHFTIRIKVVAILGNGGRTTIYESRSGALIVRGRSPRNFQSRKDTPLSGTVSHARKAQTGASQMARNMSGDPAARPTQAGAPGKTSHAKVEASPAVLQPPPSVQSFFDPNDFQMSQDFGDGMTGSGNRKGGAMTAIPQEPFAMDKHRGYAASSPDFAKTVQPVKRPKIAPVALSLVEEEAPKMAAPPKKESATPSSKRPLGRPTRALSFSINTASTPDESADLLYEYFPLGLDDWMPPVDAVYRPHVVHHIKMSADPRDPKAAAGRSKRYFSEVGT